MTDLSIDLAHQRLQRRLYRHRVIDVCAASGLHKNTISNVRSGRCNPTLALMLKIERALDAMEAK